MNRSSAAPFSVLPAMIDCAIVMLSTTCASPIVAATPPPPMFGFPRNIQGTPVTSFSAIVEPITARYPPPM